MKASGQSLFPVVMLAMLAALTFWLDRATRNEGGDDGKNRHDPDFVVQDYTFRKLDAQGKLRFVQEGRKMTHYPDDDTTEIEQLLLTSYASVRPVHVRAQTAVVTKDGQSVTLKDNVYGWSEAGGGSPETNFTTSRLVAYPDQDIAQTDAPVTIVQGRSRITGVGMDVDNKQNMLTLRSQVRGSIAPRKGGPNGAGDAVVAAEPAPSKPSSPKLTPPPATAKAQPAPPAVPAPAAQVAAKSKTTKTTKTKKVAKAKKKTKAKAKKPRKAP